LEKNPETKKIKGTPPEAISGKRRKRTVVQPVRVPHNLISKWSSNVRKDGGGKKKVGGYCHREDSSERVKGGS